MIYSHHATDKNKNILLKHKDYQELIVADIKLPNTLKVHNQCILLSCCMVFCGIGALLAGTILILVASG